MTHLNENDIIRAVIDTNDITNDQRIHLESCSLCAEKKRDLMIKLEKLSEYSIQYAPQPQRKIQILSKDSPKFWMFFKPIWGSALSVIVLMLIIYMSFHIVSKPDLSISKNDQLTETDPQIVMLDIQALEETELPEYYDYISGKNDSYSYMDDDFMDFVLPMEDASDSASVVKQNGCLA